MSSVKESDDFVTIVSHFHPIFKKPSSEFLQFLHFSTFFCETKLIILFIFNNAALFILLLDRDFKS